jgi:uncharacterized protein (DUF1800 family)
MALALSLLLAMPSAGFAAPAGSASASNSQQTGQPAQLQGDERILHALNRFTFGVRPGDLDAIRAIGLEKWFVQQLHPATIDNSALEARLAQFPAMQWSIPDLFYRLPSNGIIRQTANGKLPLPNDPTLRVIYNDEIARYEARQQQKQDKQQAASQQLASLTATAKSPAMGAAPANEPLESGMMNNLPAAGTIAESQPPDRAQIARVLAMPPAARLNALTAMSQPQFDSFRKALKGPERAALTAGFSPAQKQLAAALENPQRTVIDELLAERLTRDIDSNAQLQEVMTDFWLNHFNVFLHKNDETPYYLVSYERDVIRPRALGKFEDLLEATAHSPAMLLYLDNSSSTGPDSLAAGHAQSAQARRPNANKPAAHGINENYARELMELHTLGVNGGYTQADVTQVARVLTGWTVDRPQRGGQFLFDATRHEPGAKKVLGKKIKENGEQEGRQLLHLLATRPATAKFISRKLAVRFVGDNPPPALVARMTKTYLSSGGDIAAVLTTVFHSPEFWSQDDYRAKVKTPLEFVVSAARASNAVVDNPQPLVNALRDMGMPLYGAVPPTGYKWDASDWVSTGALVNRMNFALNLAAKKLPGVTIAWSTQPIALTRVDDGARQHSFAESSSTSMSDAKIPTPQSEERRLESLLVDGGVSSTTRAAVLDQFQSQMQAQSQSMQGQMRTTSLPAAARVNASAQPATDLENQDELLAGLLLGSPEFQRR